MNEGKEINDRYLAFTDGSPIMLPPAPSQTYIDIYLDQEEGPSSSKYRQEKRLQADYETEVKVYRALESLEDQDIVVLHGFEYTHHQYRLFDTDHVRQSCMKCKNASNTEGECDFIVISKNYFAIIEVKNIPHYKDEEITEVRTKELFGSLIKSQEQGEKTKSFIENIMKQVDSLQCQILMFSAFPNTNREQYQEMVGYQNRIIFAEDFLNFSNWWQNNVLDKVLENMTDMRLTEEVKYVMVAIWCTDKKDCDQLKCSLGKCIEDTDEELKKGKITFSSKKRPPNSNVIKATKIEGANMINGINIFRDIIGVENLTAEQYDAFNRDQNLFIINGPAGSGKTILLLAKIIQLIKSNEENRVVLFTFTSKESYQRCQAILQRAEISNTAIDRIQFYDKNTNSMVQSISESRRTNQVVLVNITDPLSELSQQTKSFGDVLVKLICSNTHVFVDDIQGQLYHFLQSAEYMFKRFKELSTTNRVWIACDLTQITVANANKDPFYSQPFTLQMPPENRVTLSLNLRNTYDLAGILSKIREQLVECIPKTEIRDIDIVFPLLKPGHMIHGPRTTLHVIEKKVDRNDMSLIDRITTKELNKLLNTDGSCSFDIGLVHQLHITNMSKETFPMLSRRVEEQPRTTKNRIQFCEGYYCYSAEYPAVVVIKDHGPNLQDKAPLHLLMSRARVYCSVILFTTRRETLLEHELLDELLHKLQGDVKIIRYD